MAICKICKKTFKQLTATHVKTHGMESLDHYHKFTESFVVPKELIDENDKLEAEYSQQRSEKAIEQWNKKHAKDEEKAAIAKSKEPVDTTDMNSILQSQFQQKRKGQH